MKMCLLIIIALFFTGCGNGSEADEPFEERARDLGFIEVINDELEQILNVDAVPEIIGDGFEWSEGPVWVEEYQFLLFSDVPENRIYKWTESDGISVYLEPSGYTGTTGQEGSNGLIIGNDGSLLLCQHGDHSIARMEAPLDDPRPEFFIIADQYEGNRFNSPNDLVQHSSGDIYMTDPPYGLEGYADDPARELDYQGVFRIDTDGAVHLQTDELTRPNGLAFTPDEQQLYVANSDPRQAIWMVYDVGDDGNISNGRLFYDATDKVGDEPGLPDGMKVTSDGYIFATGPGGVWIFTPEGGLLGKIKTGEFISNLAFDEYEQTLYMTADSYLLRLEL